MTHRLVGDVMTRQVATVAEDTPFKELAAMMTSRHVSALPVTTPDNHVTGLVSEADLLPKEEVKDDPGARRLPWLRRWATRARSQGRTARDVMTYPVITISPGATVVEAARAMDRSHVRRLPVVEPGGRLAGIVSRGDLLRVFVRPDQEIEDEIRREVFGEYLQANPSLVEVSVREGVVTLAGEVERKSMIRPAVQLANSVDGVVDVTDRLWFAEDDTRPQPPPGQVGYDKPDTAWPGGHPRM